MATPNGLRPLLRLPRRRPSEEPARERCVYYPDTAQVPEGVAANTTEKAGYLDLEQEAQRAFNKD
jgi:hypothetical protein